MLSRLRDGLAAAAGAVLAEQQHRGRTVESVKVVSGVRGTGRSGTW
jgi:hypothetical protein